MDEDEKNYWNDVLGKLNVKLDDILDKLAADRADIDSNGVLGQLLELRSDVHDLRSEHDTTREMVLKLPGTILGALEQPLLRRIRATEGRLDKLENPEGP